MQQRRRCHLLDVALGDGGIAVPGEDHLALLGQLEPPVHRPGRLRQHGPVGRAATTAERTAAAVEERQGDVVLPGPGRDPGLRVVQGERRRRRSHVLGGVAVAEHHLHPPTGVGEPLLDPRVLHDLGQGVDAGLQVGEGLEQRDHVEDRCGFRRTHRYLSKLIHRSDIRCLLRETHDVATAGELTVATLHARDRTEGLQDLGRALVECVARAGCRQGLGMHLRVLPDLQFGQMEAERLQLPDQRLQVGVGDPGRTGRDQRLLHRSQVGHALGGAGVAEVGVSAAGRGQPFGHDQQHPPVRLGRRPLGDVGRSGRRRAGAGVATVRSVPPRVACWRGRASWIARSAAPPARVRTSRARWRLRPHAG